MGRSADDFLKSIEGGRIVASSDLNIHQIVEAKANNKFYVDDDGMGYAILPWELTTAKDLERRK